LFTVFTPFTLSDAAAESKGAQPREAEPRGACRMGAKPKDARPLEHARN
jgi:hypothetical protein